MCDKTEPPKIRSLAAEQTARVVLGRFPIASFVAVCLGKNSKATKETLAQSSTTPYVLPRLACAWMTLFKLNGKCLAGGAIGRRSS